MLVLEDFTLYRGRLCVADKLNICFETGKVYAILGPNGVGKSSLIKGIFTELPFKGKLSFQNQSITPELIYTWRKRIGYMPQDSVVDASLSALEVVLLGQLDNLSTHVSDEQLHAAITLMHELGIEHLAGQDVLSLSGGQRQMVMFAQVLLKNPELLLLDEPVSALDMHHQCVLLERVHQQTHERNLTTLMILHDLNLASQFADEVVLLSGAKIHGKGQASEVLTRDLVEKLYHVPIYRHQDEQGLPIIIPARRRS